MIPYTRGRVSEQAHVGIPEGLIEEEYARNGFFGRYAHLYRSEAPVGWTEISGPLRPQSFDLSQAGADADFLRARKTFLANEDVKIQFAKLTAPMPYFFRNADGDDLFFVHEGTGRIETDFGALAYEPGDYILVPRGTVYRLLCAEPSAFLIIEAHSEIGFPDKGMLGQHALFDPAILKAPTPSPVPEGERRGRFELKIKRCEEITSVIYPFYPINTVGWKGTLTVWQLNARDIRPVSCDRYHLPPSAHTTFVAQNFVVCSFLPRPLENGDPKAVKVPFYHSNIDFDEVLFYHAGEFFSRTGIKPGMMTFHPQGIHHGPQEGAVSRSRDATRTSEVAVMIDTKRPLKALPEAQAVENKDYWASWKGAAR
jgi:homogentisate 1,2-dioxygenase